MYSHTGMLVRVHVSVYAHTSLGARRIAARALAGSGVLKTASRSIARVLSLLLSAPRMGVCVSRCPQAAATGVRASCSQVTADTALFTRCRTDEGSSSVTGEAGESCVGDAANSRCLCAARGVMLGTSFVFSRARDWWKSLLPAPSLERAAGMPPGPNGARRLSIHCGGSGASNVKPCLVEGRVCAVEDAVPDRKFDDRMIGSHAAPQPRNRSTRAPCLDQPL